MIVSYFMKKTKIAISLDAGLLSEVDSRVDGKIIRSRSQAMEVFLRKGLFESDARIAVILLKGEHQKYALKEIDGKPLILKQVAFFAQHGIESVLVVTQKSDSSLRFMNELTKTKLPVKVVEDDAKGTAQALLAIKEHLKSPFVVQSGDTYTEFDLSKMIRKLLSSPQVAVMGLMSRSQTEQYGTAVLDGDLIVSFEEKKPDQESFVVNAGIYVFKPEVFDYISSSAKSLEKDVFTKLAHERQLLGFFTHGVYVHAPELEAHDKQ